MNKPAHSSLARSFERYMRAENRSDRTIATHLHDPRQAEAFLRTRGTTIEAATRADLEAFMADLLARCTASTAGAYHKVLKSLYGWLAEEEAIPNQPDPVRRLVTRMGEHPGAPEDMDLRSPASHAGALSPEPQGQGGGAGGDGGVEPAPSTLPASRSAG